MQQPKKIDDSLIARADDMVQAFESGALLSALTIALTLPDICGKRLYPDKPSGERYAQWFDKYISPYYVDSPRHPSKADGDYYFNGTDCYRLRCVFLHEGINALDMSRRTPPNYNIVQFRLFDSSKEGADHVSKLLRNDIEQPMPDTAPSFNRVDLDLRKFIYAINDGVHAFIEDHENVNSTQPINDSEAIFYSPILDFRNHANSHSTREHKHWRQAFLGLLLVFGIIVSYSSKTRHQ